ncbi:carbohydrate ABC transporter permease [Atrimonas thermophila]|jgi:multiple sugar transport system permease protein|uniref:carbohydrate ABC transporter permease n=1 Tax=Atrimonas thermophila TaxID=3064161 RepID=UPI00399C8397
MAHALRQKKRRFFDRNIAFLMILPAIVIVFALIVVPMIYSFYISLTNLHLLHPSRTRFVGFQNYVKLLKDSIFWRALFNTVIFMGIAVNLEFVLGLAIAQLIFKTIRGKNIIRTAIMMPMMFAPVLVGFQFKWFFNDQVGLVNNLLYLFTGEYHLIPWLIEYPLNLFAILVAEIWMSTPFMVIILLAGLTSLPVEPFEAASVDGASPWQQFRYITLPLLGPFTYIAMVIRSLDLGRAYDLVRIMTAGGPAHRSEMIWTYTFRLAITDNKFGMGTAMSFITVAISFVFVIYLFRQLAKSRQGVY